MIRLKPANYLEPGEFVMWSPDFWLPVVGIENINGHITLRLGDGVVETFRSGDLVIYDAHEVGTDNQVALTEIGSVPSAASKASSSSEGREP